MRFETAVERLLAPDRFRGPLPVGPPSLMPVLSDDRLRPRLEPTRTTRPAAVLVLIYPGAGGEAHLVLTERLTYDGPHSGEVSFPGGKAEPSDADAVATALREAAEEVSLRTDDGQLEVLGALDDVPVSDYRITPIVAVNRTAPELVPNPGEVARILLPPVSSFLPAASVEVVERTIQGWPLRYGGYRVEGLHVWGATGRILGQLGAVLGDP